MKPKDFILGLQHIGLPTNDMDATVSFYEGLGFETVYRTVNEKANEAVVFLKLGDVTIEAYENKKAALQTGAIDHIALHVEHVEKLHEMMCKEKYTIVSDGVEFLPFWKNGVKFFIVEGPNRERVEFNQYL